MRIDARVDESELYKLCNVVRLLPATSTVGVSFFKDETYHEVDLWIDTLDVILSAVQGNTLYARCPWERRKNFTPDVLMSWFEVNPADHEDY